MSDPATPTNLAAYWQQQIDQWKGSGQLLMIALMDPPMIGLMAPFFSAD